MLTLSRKRNESLIIGDNIIVTVIAIRQGHVRLGISAPGEVGIHRAEIWARIQEEKKGGAA